MATAFVVLVWLLNLGISIWNAYAVGLAWVETKHAGGWPRFMAWMGAVMSASGFSWCYLIILAYAAQGLGWLTTDDVALLLQIGYVLLIPGILVSGMMIMLDSWARAYRSRRIADIGVAAWNTYAQIHNSYHAIRDLDRAFGSVVDSLRDKSGSDRKGGGAALVLVFVLVILALVSGVITTAVIINRVAGSSPLPEQHADEEQESEVVKR
jgi:hypothetical protein